ncbi:hypothetical protein I3760_14G037100 [Carya illinoinensis]|nr:hypothetical protein I3760_14G037100 [Carya illinoinensis]KAG2669483.1 hypothetical protein I3760_14G037100 [Carya illinoinensis]
MLFQLGMFMWVSYIPRGSLPEWLNQCTRIKASIASDCPNLAVQKCGFRLINLHDEVEFKQTIRHCVASLSDAWGLERGQYISLELLKAIKESKYAIIVFLINYIFSKWSLIELTKIAECMKENGLTVFLVFYHVADPSHVRNQKGTFAEAFVKH